MSVCRLALTMFYMAFSGNAFYALSVVVRARKTQDIIKAVGCNLNGWTGQSLQCAHSVILFQVALHLCILVCTAEGPLVFVRLSVAREWDISWSALHCIPLGSVACWERWCPEPGCHNYISGVVAVRCRSRLLSLFANWWELVFSAHCGMYSVIAGITQGFPCSVLFLVSPIVFILQLYSFHNCCFSFGRTV